MSDEIDREIITKKEVSTPRSPSHGYVSEQSTTRVSNDNSAGGLILGVLLTLALGIGAGLYFLNNRTTPSPIVVPGATNTIKEKDSTVIERSNTTIKEPSAPQPAPNVEVNVPAVVPKVEINVPAPSEAPVPAPTSSGR